MNESCMLFYVCLPFLPLYGRLIITTSCYCRAALIDIRTEASFFDLKLARSVIRSDFILLAYCSIFGLGKQNMWINISLASLVS